MTRKQVHGMTTDDLVTRFANIALRQHDALWGNKIELYNALYGDMDLVCAELCSRPGDQRRALLSLLDHDDPHVRLKAAVHTLTLEPERSRQVLQAVRESREMFVGLMAGMIMRGLEDGSFIPT